MVEEMLAEAERTKRGAPAATEEAKEQQKAARELPSPVSSDGLFEYRFVQAFIELLTGRPTTARPDAVWLPKNEKSEPLALVLSSTEQFYYRVTPSHCSCRGWFYSKGRYGLGKCRHHILAFPEVARENATIPGAEEVLRRRGPRIGYHPSQHHYSPVEDTIFLPGLEQFESSAAYYSVAFHELIHWTGGRPRLARPEIAEYHIGREIRSREELTAEMGAAYICRLCSLDSPETVENSAAYIQSWLGILRDHPKWVLQASKQARAAVEFILTGQVPSKEVTCHEAATA